MDRKNTKIIGRKRYTLGGRSDLRTLMRSRVIQGILVATATVQGLAVAATTGDTKVASVRVEAAPLQEAVALAPVTAEAPKATGTRMSDAAISDAWRESAMERESDRLAAKYKADGFKVTETLAAQIHEAAVEHGIDPEIAFGLVRAESSFRNQATSPVGAVGLTQLMPATARWMEPGVTRSQLRNPETNLRVGFKYLKYLIEKYDGNEDLALVAYNRGPGTVDKALKRGRNPDNGYAAFVRGKKNHGHKLYTR